MGNAVGVYGRPARKLAGVLLAGAVLLTTAVTAGAQSGPAGAMGSPAGKSAPGAAVALASGRAVEASPDDGALGEAATSTHWGAPQLGDSTPEAYRAAKARAQQAGTAEASSSLRLDSGVSGAAQAAAPTLATGWQSFASTGWAPPAPQVAVGPSNGVAAVNGGVKVFSKTGSQSASWSLDTFFPATARCGASTCTASSYTYAPWVIYDSLSERFVILAVTRNEWSKLSRILIAVSKTSTASTSTAGWWMYGFDGKLQGNTSVDGFMDYARVGVTKNALVITGNQYRWDYTFLKAKVRVLWKSQVYNGVSSVNWYDFWDLDGAPFSVVPATSSVPSTTAHLLNTGIEGSNLHLRTLSIPATRGGTPILSAKTTRTVDGYAIPPDAKQLNTATTVETGDARLRMAVRSAAGIFAVHTTSCTWVGSAGEKRSCLRYYQIDSITLNVTKTSTYGHPDFFFSYPGVASDSWGDIVIPFQFSGATAYPSSRYTARNSLATDLQDSAGLGTGTGCYRRIESGRNRWGDYTGASFDASTGKFWVMAAHASGTSSTCTNNTWATRIGVVNTP